MARAEAGAIIVTGATSGLGLEAAKRLVRNNTVKRLILTARNAERGAAALDAVRSACSACSGPSMEAADVTVMELDLACRASIEKFCREYRALGFPIRALLANAGIWQNDRQETLDGIEATMGTNHYGHFLLAYELRQSFIKDSRLVIVSSHLHTKAKMDWDDLERERSSYDGKQVYEQSKLANLLWQQGLVKRLPGVGVHALHPGFCKTGLFDSSLLSRIVMPVVLFAFGRDSADGAIALSECCTRPDLDGQTGKYYACPGKTEADFREEQPKDHARDEADAERLWELSESKWNVKWPVQG